MWYQLKSYLRFLIRSTDQHGVHSPFVYELITRCFYSKTKHPEYESLYKYRKRLLEDKATVQVKDFGQGSRVFKSNTRKVSAIVKNAGITPKRQRLLFRITKYFQSENILELGTSLGLATAALSLGNKTARVTSVEGCPATAQKAGEMFQAFNLKNVHQKLQTFEEYFEKASEKTYNLVYIDGNHNKEKTLQYFNCLLKKTDKDSVFIFDDIYWSKPMTEAWQEIVSHKKVTVSIDTFYWGMVFFRKEQPKQHFVIRIG